MNTRHYRHDATNGSDGNNANMNWMNEELWRRMTIAVCKIGFPQTSSDLDVKDQGSLGDRYESE